MTSPLDPRIAAALQLHRPYDYYVDLRTEFPTAPPSVCLNCELDAFPCATATALGVREGVASSHLEALTWWWEAHGIDLEAARVAAALEETEPDTAAHLSGESAR